MAADARRTGEPDVVSLDDLGNRLRILRGLNDLTQRELAVAAGVSKSLLSKVETGQRRGTWDLAVAVSEALKVDPAVVLGIATDSPNAADRISACLPELRRIMAEYDCPPDLGRSIRPLEVLAGDVDKAGKLRLQSGYAALGLMLPSLLEELTVAVHTYSGTDRERAFGLLALGYRSADAVAHKLGHHDLSTVAIDRIRWAAEHSGDDRMEATAAYVRAESFFIAGSVETGLRLLATAGERISRQTITDRKAAAVYGSLHARAAVLAAFGGKASAAWTHLEIADGMANLIGKDVKYFQTSFGPATMKVHEVAVAVELSDPDEALRRSHSWSPPDDLPAEKASHHYIDLARAHVWRNEFDKALSCLQLARVRAPQHTRSHPGAREVVTAVTRRSRRPTDAARGFALWLGVTP